MLDMFNVYKKSWIVTAGEKNCCRLDYLIRKEPTDCLAAATLLAL